MNVISNYPIFLDIDWILCCTKAKRPENTLFFKREGKIFFVPLAKADFSTHYIFPGVIELLTLLHQQEDVQLSLFSAGLKIRNKPFVKQLLTEAFGPEEYEKIEDKVSLSHSLSKLYSGVTYGKGELADRKWTSLSKHDALYHLGLQTLRQINPNLKFMHLIVLEIASMAFPGMIWMGRSKLLHGNGPRFFFWVG